MDNKSAEAVIQKAMTYEEQKKLIRKALSLAHVTELEALLMVTEIYEEVRDEQSKSS